MRQRHFVDERGIFNHVGRGVDVGGVVHAGRNALRQYAGFRHIMDAFDLDVFEVGPVRRLESEAMGEIVKFQSHRVVGVGLEFNAADFDHLSFSR